MKLETHKIHKTDLTVSLVPHLRKTEDGNTKPVAFYIRGKYLSAKKADNLFNRTTPSPKLPQKALDIIMTNVFQNGDIPCYVIDRGIDIEIVVE